MTTPTVRSLLDRGYVPADETRTRLREYIDAGVIVRRLEDGLGVRPYTLKQIICGRNQHVPGDLAEVISELSVDTARALYGPQQPAVNAWELGLLIAGHDIDVAAHNKPLYALALWRDHGWNRTRIARTLRMSGATVNKVLSPADRAGNTAA